MNTIFEAYNLPVDGLIGFYRRLNEVITYPDGMTTSLGIVYWGQDEHLIEIERAIPIFIENGTPRFKDVMEAIRTPARSKKFSEKTNISKDILRILKHDIELWLPKAIQLDKFDFFQNNPNYTNEFSRIGLKDQLAVISAGQIPSQREKISLETSLDISTINEIVKYCDFYRTGKNLEHIRAKLYYDMGFDTWQKWANHSSEDIISKFIEYIQRKNLEEKRLIPWPKEVRNGIEWAKMHLEIFSVQW
jgi:hypothetical protein